MAGENKVGTAHITAQSKTSLHIAQRRTDAKSILNLEDISTNVHPRAPSVRDSLAKPLLQLLMILGGVLCIPSAPVYGRENTTDILLVPRPDRLVVLNEYQQRSSPEERRFLRPFMPMRVVQPDFQLPDGYTHSLLVDVDGTLLYLLKNQAGGVIGSEDGPPSIRISGAILLYDTMRVTEPTAVTVVSPDRRTQQTMQRGSLFITRFRHKRDLYIMIPGRSPTFGWILDGATSDRGRWQRVDGTARRATHTLAAVLPRIRARAEEINSVLDGLFSEFNQMTGRQYAAPSWQVTPHDGEIVCELEAVPFPGAYRESTALFARDIQNMLLGSRSTVILHTDRITIRETEE